MTVQQFDDLTEHLLEQPFHVIDFLPRQVPADCGGQYFAVERFYLENPQVLKLGERFANLLMQLNCYYDLVTGDGENWAENLTPAERQEKVINCEITLNAYLNILLPSQQSLITLYAGDLYMTIYNASNELLQTVTQLAAAQGLFVREVEN